MEFLNPWQAYFACLTVKAADAIFVTEGIVICINWKGLLTFRLSFCTKFRSLGHCFTVTVRQWAGSTAGQTKQRLLSCTWEEGIAAKWAKAPLHPSLESSMVKALATL